MLLIGHPKLRNDLRRPQMEEIGYRTTTFESRACPAAAASNRLAAEDLRAGRRQAGDMIDPAAVDLLAERLRTPLQIEMHLTLAFEHVFRLGERRVSVEVVEQVLSRGIDARVRS